MFQQSVEDLLDELITQELHFISVVNPTLQTNEGKRKPSRTAKTTSTTPKENKAHQHLQLWTTLASHSKSLSFNNYPLMLTFSLFLGVVMRCDKFVLRYGRLIAAVLRSDQSRDVSLNIFNILPVELLAMIVRMLDVKDCLAFACVCRVRPLIFPYFRHFNMPTNFFLSNK